MSENWIFNFSLDPPIDCKDDLLVFDGIDLKIIVSDKQQHEIIGFGIAINNTTEEDGNNQAAIKARRLTDLLVSTSCTSSYFNLCGTLQIDQDGKRRVARIIESEYLIKNNVNLNMIKNINGIIDGSNSELNEKLNFIGHAINASYNRDSISAIRFLDLACNENSEGKLKKFHCLRHALSHSKRSLKYETIKSIKEGFGNDYFEFTADRKFNFASAKNLRNLKTEAKNLFKIVKDDLNNLGCN